MADLNHFVLAGRVMSQPKILGGNSQEGNGEVTATKMLRFTIACHRPVRDEIQPSGWAERTDRIPVVCWGWLAERVERQITTGAYVTASGRLQTYEYERQVSSGTANRTDELASPQFPEQPTSMTTVTVTGFELALNDFTVVIKGRQNQNQEETSATENEAVAE